MRRAIWLLAFISLAGCGRPTEKEAKKSTGTTISGNSDDTTAPEVTGATKANETVVQIADSEKPLWEQYSINPAAADGKYKGKVVEFDTYANVDQDNGRNILVSRSGPGDVYRIYPRQNQDQRLAKLPGGQRVKVRGRVRGAQADPRGFRGKVVVIENAEVLGYYVFKGAEKTFVPVE